MALPRRHLRDPRAVTGALNAGRRADSLAVQGLDLGAEEVEIREMLLSASEAVGGRAAEALAGSCVLEVDCMRVALHTRLKPGAEEAYEQAHQGVPRGLTDAIRQAGVHRWTIWRSGLDLFHIIDCDDYAAALATLNALPVNQRWQARMAEYLDVAHDYSETGSAAGLPVVWQLSPHVGSRTK